MFITGIVLFLLIDRTREHIRRSIMEEDGWNSPLAYLMMKIILLTLLIHAILFILYFSFYLLFVLFVFYYFKTYDGFSHNIAINQFRDDLTDDEDLETNNITSMRVK